MCCANRISCSGENKRSVGECPFKCAVPTDFLSVGKIKGLLVSAPLNVQQALFLLGEEMKL